MKPERAIRRVGEALGPEPPGQRRRPVGRELDPAGREAVGEGEERVDVAAPVPQDEQDLRVHGGQVSGVSPRPSLAARYSS